MDVQPTSQCSKLFNKPSQKKASESEYSYSRSTLMKKLRGGNSLAVLLYGSMDATFSQQESDKTGG